MEDLLKEEEFVRKDSYNPWKGFVVFYVATFVLCWIIFLQSKTEYPMKIIVNILLGLSLLAIPFVMIFHNKRNIFLSVGTIIFSISISMSVVFLAYTIIDVFNDGIYFLINDPKFYFQAWGIMLLYGLLCSGIIFGIRAIKKRRVKYNTKHLKQQ